MKIGIDIGGSHIGIALVNEYGKIKTETGEITNNHEIKRLKKENLKLKEELEILKKAIAIFTPK